MAAASCSPNASKGCTRILREFRRTLKSTPWLYDLKGFSWNPKPLKVDRVPTAQGLEFLGYLEGKKSQPPMNRMKFSEAADKNVNPASVQGFRFKCACGLGEHNTFGYWNFLECCWASPFNLC